MGVDLKVEIKQLKNGWVKVLKGHVSIQQLNGPSRLYVKIAWHAKRILCATAPKGELLLMAMGGVLINTGSYYKVIKG